MTLTVAFAAAFAAALLIAFALLDAEGFPTPIKTKNRVGKANIDASPLPAASEKSIVAAKAPDLSDIFEQNKAWKAAREAEDPDFFNDLNNQSKPKFFWIGCADARSPANEIMGEMAGSVYVARNLANLVVTTDFNLMSALQYAVNYLKVSHIIVCGHYDCEGVRAAVARFDHKPPLENWLRNVRDVYRLHKRELDRIRNPEERHRRLVELNVIEQCINLYKTGIVQRKRVETYKENREYATPRIHPLVFDSNVGRLKRLNTDFNKCIKDLNDIYDLYDGEAELEPVISLRVKR